jgi:hypothetical protein
MEVKEKKAEVASKSATIEVNSSIMLFSAVELK